MMNFGGRLNEIANATECIKEFGNPDVTGIGFRWATYVAVGILLFFMIYGDRKRAWIDTAVGIGMLPTIINPPIALGFLFRGEMDQYTSLVLLHGSLLVNAPQTLHLLKFQRRKYHRWAYCANTVLSTILFGASSHFFRVRGDDSLNFCPTLLEAIATFRGRNIAYTVFLWVYNMVLTGVDFYVARRDGIRNAIPPDRSRGEHSRRTFPKWLTWNSADPWDARRAAYCIAAALLFVYSVFHLECRIIQAFHSYIRNIDGISSKENDWAIGQISALVVGGVTAFYILQGFARDKLRLARIGWQREAKQSNVEGQQRRTIVRDTSGKFVSGQRLQSISENRPQDGGSPTTGWRVLSDAEVQRRLSQRVLERPEDEVDLGDLTSPLKGIRYTPGSIRCVPGRRFSLPYDSPTASTSHSLERRIW